MKVLIADNDLFAREGIANGVDWNRYGFETVYMAKNGLEVLSTVQMTRPDLIITEASLPYLDGISMIEKLRAKNEDICFIVVSDRRDTVYLKAAIHLNIFEYILKPINLNELIDAVQRAKIHISKTRAVAEESPALVRSLLGRDRNIIRESTPLDSGEESLEDCEIKAFAEAVLKGNIDSAITHFARKKQEFLSKKTCSKVLLNMLCTSYFSVCDQEIKRRGGKLAEVFASPIGTMQTIISCENISETFEILEHAVYEMLDYIKNLYAKSTNTDMEKAREYINKHYSDMAISLNDVAKQVNMNPAYFSVLFKRDTGETFINYLTNVRIAKAGDMLAKTNMKIYEIAYAVGYDNPTYFSTVFKKITKKSPQDYRKNKNLN